MRLKDFEGQQEIKDDLHYHLQNAKVNYTTLDHIMFYGPAGLGKTTLANIIAEELGVGISQITGTELTKASTLYDMMDEIRQFGILFIDEIHRTPTSILEILYGPLQMINNLKLDKHPTDIPFFFQGVSITPFTLIGGTTGAGMIAKPLRDRIILSYRLRMYTEIELVNILCRKDCPTDTAIVIAKRSRGTPRIALNYFVRLRNESLSEENMTTNRCKDMFKRNGIDKEGYDTTDLRIMEYLYTNIRASENELHRSLDIDMVDYKNMYEPFLLTNGVIRITARGRILTAKGKKYFEESQSVH